MKELFDHTLAHLWNSAVTRTESHAISMVQWYPHDTGIFITSSVDRMLRIWDTNELCVSKGARIFILCAMLFCILGPKGVWIIDCLGK